MMLRIWRLPAAERAARDVSSLRVVLHLGAPCPPWLKAVWIEWLGPEVLVEVYAVPRPRPPPSSPGASGSSAPGSVGRALYGEFRVVDGEGRTSRRGEIGEIVMRRRPEDAPTYRYVGAEARAFGEGWESLGDMGWLDAAGYLYLADRRTDLILVGGANMYPAEVEAALDEHPRVRSSAVIGLPDDDLGQRVHAIVHVDGEVSDGELRDHLARATRALQDPPKLRAQPNAVAGRRGQGSPERARPAPRRRRRAGRACVKPRPRAGRARTAPSPHRCRVATRIHLRR